MNVLTTPCNAELNICLYVGPRGNGLYMPGFANQTLGKYAYGMCIQETDQDDSPVRAFNLGKGRHVLHMHPVDDGSVWIHVSDVSHNNDVACEVAAIQPEDMEHVTTAFLARLAYGHCGDAAMKLIAQAPKLFGDVLSNDCVTGLRHQC